MYSILFIFCILFKTDLGLDQGWFENIFSVRGGDDGVGAMEGVMHSLRAFYLHTDNSDSVKVSPNPGKNYHLSPPPPK
jgi:hypothetical protein